MSETATRMSQRDRLLAVLAGEQPDRIPFIFLGVSDMVMGHNEIDRVRWIAGRVEEHERGLP